MLLPIASLTLGRTNKLQIAIQTCSELPISILSAAAAATAAPILIKLAEFLSKLGIDVKEVSEVGKRVLAKTG